MSEPVEDKDRKFLVELARVALTDINTIFCVSTTLSMDRSAVEKDRENYKEDIEAVGKAFVRRWNADNNDPQKWHKLREAFEKAHCIGPFESVANNVGFQLPAYEADNNAQVELADHPADGFEYKLNNFLEQLPRLISSKNILWDVGVCSRLTDDEIQSIKENNPGNINQAGRELIRTILNKSKGTLINNILNLQDTFEYAKKIAPFVDLLRESGITAEDLVEVGEEETTRAETGNDQIQLPTNNDARSSPDLLRHFDSLVPPLAQAGGVQRTQKDLAEAVARKGYDYTEALYATTQLQNPTEETIIEWLRNKARTQGGATGHTRPKLQAGLQESGYGSMSDDQLA